MTLSYYDLCELVENGVITGVEHEQINGASIDVHLGHTLVIEVPPPQDHVPRAISIKRREVFPSRILDITNKPYALQPGEFVLGQTREMFNLPDDICAEFKLKSSGARTGLENALATWCDPNWHGSVLTLELTNLLRYYPLELEAGMFVGQMVFHRVRPVPLDRSYAARGRYNNDLTAQTVKE